MCCSLFCPAGGEGGQEGIREKTGGKRRKKTCIPVGDADADVKGC